MCNEILLKYLKCETTPDEEKQILDWLDESQDHRLELDAMSAAFTAVVLHAPVRKTAKTIFVRNWGRTLRQFAAVAAVLAVILTGSWMFSSYNVRQITNQMMALEVPKGQRMNITLSDGTSICLNSGAKLEYPALFSKAQRNVRLSGEAVFDVAQDKEKPFVIHTFACDVKVLGTKFNINADEQHSMFSTLLIRGCVQLENLISGDCNIIMQPHDCVKLDGSKLSQYTVEDFEAVQWTEDIISLKNTSFEELIGKLENAYDIRVRVEREYLPRLHCLGKIHISDGVEHAMEILQLGADFKYEYDKDKAILIIK